MDRNILKKYNEASQAISESHKWLYINEVDLENWSIEDFVDASHFNASGNKKLAGMIYDEIKFRPDSIKMVNGQ